MGGIGGKEKGKGAARAVDTERIDEAVLALLWLGSHGRNGEPVRAWKGFDWQAMNRLHENGFISDPVSKTKSVAFTDKGRSEAERLFSEFPAAEFPVECSDNLTGRRRRPASHARSLRRRSPSL